MRQGMATDAEIAVLEALAAQGEILESKMGTCTPPFRSRLRLVDRQRCLLLLDRSSDEAANMALLALPRADLQVEWGEWRIAFVAGNLVAFSHEGSEAIRLDFPDAVAISRRRMYQRTQDPRPPLQCEAYPGAAAAFEAVITDVSQGGIGIVIDSAAALMPGTVLPGCRLVCPDCEPVIVDLEVRHTTIDRLPGGLKVVRAGCRFLNLSPAVMGLIAKYVDTKPPGG
ncbi:MAG: flagellar regulator YcgR PilZN domain-containing protein [Pseudomonadota bacterium]